MRYDESVASLAEILAAMAVSTIAEVVPGADSLVTEGEVDEAGISRLRVSQVLDGRGAVLVDADHLGGGPAGRAVSYVESQYLDRLAEVTGGELLGVRAVSAP